MLTPNGRDWESVVRRQRPNLVIGDVQGLADQASQMPVTQGVDHATAVLAGNDQTGQAKLRQVLTHGSPRRTRGLGQGRDVGLTPAEPLHQRKARAIGKQSQHRRGDIQPLAATPLLRRVCICHLRAYTHPDIVGLECAPVHVYGRRTPSSPAWPAYPHIAQPEGSTHCTNTERLAGQKTKSGRRNRCPRIDNWV